MKKLFLLFLTISIAGFSQNLVNHSVISITPSGLLFVSGNITNNGTIINNGDMQVGGAWVNNSEYDAGVGKITFNSDLPQNINHNAQSFSRLTISGGGVKNFLADITIEDELNLAEGTLVSQNNARLIFSNNASIVGGSDQSHIQGPVYHVGSGNKLFPIGNGTIYLPVELNGLSALSEVGISVVELGGNTQLLKSTAVKTISDQRYFIVDVVSGSLQNSTVTLPVRNEDNLMDVPSLVVAEASSLNDPFVSIGNSDFTGSLANGRITSAGSITRSILAVATADESGIIVYNAIAPMGNEGNHFMRIANLPTQNRVSIFNRWGDIVYEVENYDDNIPGKRFEGLNNDGKELPSGNYFYKIEISGNSLVTGFLSLRR